MEKIPKGGWCTSFPENWLAWKKPQNFKECYKIMHVVYIGDCCKEHDDECSTRNFIDCLFRLNIVGATLIATGGFLGCLFKYPKLMYNRFKKRVKDND
ncbi:MAG: hypothetical protein L3I99_01995 [Sulfurimonas sp.]|nr:hypothetical protein [Sulfurimonas sp.]